MKSVGMRSTFSMMMCSQLHSGVPSDASNTMSLTSLKKRARWGISGNVSRSFALSFLLLLSNCVQTPAYVHGCLPDTVLGTKHR